MLVGGCAEAIATRSRAHHRREDQTMDNGTSNFMAQVQDQLNELGSVPALTVGEQEITQDFHENEFSARRCAERIVEWRHAA